MAHALLRRLDHILIRVQAETFDPLVAFLTADLRLPALEAAHDTPLFRSHSVFAGNVELVVLHVKAGAQPLPARLYGLGFALASHDVGSFKATKLPYYPLRWTLDPAQAAPEQGSAVLLGRMMGTNLAMENFFGKRLLHTDAHLLRPVRTPTRGSRSLFNRVYAAGIVYAAAYHPHWQSSDAVRRQQSAALQQVLGGGLGLVRVREVIVATPQLAQSRDRWQRLLQVKPREDSWTLGDGPTLRLISGARQQIAAMLWEVQNLKRASEFLQAHQRAHTTHKKEIALAPEALFGLRVRLVERP